MVGGAMHVPRPRDPDTPFALGEAPRSWRDFLADADALARSLTTDIGDSVDAAGEVMVACGDRYL